jgi:hypothetical protein
LKYRHPLTLPVRSVSIPTDLNLTPDLIHRLTAIRSLLALGDLELVAAASVRLESFRSEDALAAVLDALASHRYSEADQMISAILTKGLRMTTWTDPEIVMLEAELAKVTAELADLEAEHAELGHLMARFYAEHAAALVPTRSPNSSPSLPSTRIPAKPIRNPAFSRPRLLTMSGERQAHTNPAPA